MNIHKGITKEFLITTCQDLEKVIETLQAKNESEEDENTNHYRDQVTPDGIRDRMDELRRQAKYAAFNIEATQRENTYLRRLCQQASDENSDYEDYEDKE